MKLRNILISIALTVLSFCYTLLVKNIDVDSIGPNGSEVGFAKLNSWFSNLVGSNMTIYKITEVLGLLVIAIVLIYGCIGLYQLIKRKSLLKIDREIIILGCFYVLMAITYVLFEKVVINSDRILYIENGHISAEGTHKTLLSKCPGYKKLYEKELKK